MTKQLPTDQIFNTLNRVKQAIGLAVSDYLNNQVVREKAIESMEIRFRDIIGVLDTYFQCKEVLNRE